MMEYSLGKWLERIDAKLNVLLEVNGIDSETLSFTEPTDQTKQTQEQLEEPEEQIDLHEPEAATQGEMKAKTDQLQKAMNKQGSKTRWQG